MTRPLVRNILAGALAGVVGSVALRAWMTAASYAHRRTAMPDPNGPAHQVGSLVVEKLTGRSPQGEARLLTGEVVHYLFGAFTGGLYGAIAAWQPWTTAGRGVLFGTGVFLAADETSMPLLRLVPPPWTETPAAQLEHLAAHLVYGIVAESTRRRLVDRRTR